MSEATESLLDHRAAPESIRDTVEIAPDTDAGIPGIGALIDVSAMQNEFIAKRYPGGRKPVPYRVISEATGVPQQKLSVFEKTAEVDADTAMRIAVYLGYSLLLVKEEPSVEDTGGF